MLKKTKVVLLIAVVTGGCSVASGPTYNAYSVDRTGGERTFRVECNGLLEAPSTCDRKAKEICGEQPVWPIESVGPLGTTTSDGKPNTRILTFRCGARTETPVAVAPLAPHPIAVPLKVTLNGDANFDTANWTLRPDARMRLNKLIEDAQGVTFGTVEVEGFTDSVGSDAYNLTLSERRANAVAAYLRYHGLQARRVVAEGHGKVNPVATNTTAAGRSQNRRVEIRLSPN